MHFPAFRAYLIASLTGLALACSAVVLCADEFPGTPPTARQTLGLVNMVPTYNDRPGRRVFIDVITASGGPPVLTQSLTSSSLLVRSDLPAVFQVSADLDGWRDATLGTRFNLDPSLATAPPASFVRAWSAVEPISVYLPPAYDEHPDREFPLVVMLHPYTWNARRIIEEGAWPKAVLTLADELGFVLAAPQRATLSSTGQPYWNSTRSCCDFDRGGRPDVAWTLLAVASIQAQLRIDRQATFATGHSNGADLALALGAHSDVFAAVAAVSGRTGYPDEMPPPVGEPVHVLRVNGTADDVLLYAGGTTTLGPYPGVQESAGYWAARYGLTEESADPEPTLDLLPGATVLDTAVQVFRNPAGGPDLELWIHNGGHSPQFQPGFARSLVTWLLDHRRSP